MRHAVCQHQLSFLFYTNEMYCEISSDLINNTTMVVTAGNVHVAVHVHGYYCMTNLCINDFHSHIHCKQLTD